MPLFTVVFFIFSLANISFPGTVNFAGELLILVGLIQQNWFFFGAALVSLFFTTVFTMLLFNRVCFGTFRVAFVDSYCDLVRWETWVFILLFLPVLLLGVYPQGLVSVASPCVYILAS